MATGFFCKCNRNNQLDRYFCSYQECKNTICEHILRQKIFYCEEHILKIFENGIEASLTSLELDQDFFEFEYSDEEDIEKKEDSTWIGFAKVVIKSEGEYNDGRIITEEWLTYFPQELEELCLCKEIIDNFWTYGKYALTRENKILVKEWGMNYKLRFYYVDDHDESEIEQYDYYLVSIESYNIIQVNALKFKLSSREYKVILIFLSEFKKLTNQNLPLLCFELILDYCKGQLIKYKSKIQQKK